MAASRQLDLLVALQVMGWTDHVQKTETCYPQFDVTATPPNWGETGARYHRVPEYSNDFLVAWEVVNMLRAAGIEVIIGCFKAGYSIELRRWRDRRTEGVPGDPHTGRSRETFYCRTGIELLAEGICLAALSPECIAAVAAGGAR